ncbi:MAG: hypothetical protein KAJ29_01490 [Alphaproteobacteria bacterium]|nr:hypothetical protein [Alphaproteobacteria bacterium]
MKLIELFNNASLAALCPLFRLSHHIGFIRPELAHTLTSNAPDLFEHKNGTLIIGSEELSSETLTEELINLHTQLADKKILPELAPEIVDVTPVDENVVLFKLNRNLLFPLGIKSRGGHLILKYENGDFLVARRSSKVMLFKECYDVPVGGILPSNISVEDHIYTEAQEEAGLSPEDLIEISPRYSIVGARQVIGQKITNDDYEPAFPFETDGGTDFGEAFYWIATIKNGVEPCPKDGEVKKFLRFSPDTLIDTLKHEPKKWKINSGIMFLHALSHTNEDSLVIDEATQSHLKHLEA